MQLLQCGFVLEGERTVECSAVTVVAEDAPHVVLHREREGKRPGIPRSLGSLDADDGGTELTLPVRALMGPNARFQFVLVYTAPAKAKGHAVDDITAALAAGAIRVGEDAGLPLHTYPLAETGTAHQAVQDAVVGKVLVDVTA